MSYNQFKHLQLNRGGTVEWNRIHCLHTEMFQVRDGKSWIEK